MARENLFEELTFQNGEKINISSHVDPAFLDSTHWHPFVELLISLSDHNRLTVNFTSYELGMNDIAILHPGDLHMLHADSANDYYIIQFSKDLITIMGELYGIYSLIQQYHVIRYDHTNPLCDEMIYQTRRMVNQYFHPVDQFTEVQIYTHLLTFYRLLGEYCLAERTEDGGDVRTPDSRTGDLMVEACLYISQNCSAPLTLDDISRNIGISKSYFAHLFKDYLNMTFIDYLTQQRIKMAEGLMADPKAKITDIAFESGFSSVSSFNRAFKKVKKISPTEFRATLAGLSR